MTKETTDILDELNGGSSGPMWLRIAVRFGGYAVIAFFLIWFVTAKIETSLITQSDDHKTMKFYLRQVCLNTAQNDSQARSCLEVRDK